MTPETKVKKQMDRLIREVAVKAGVDYDKDTFGPFLRNGFPDTRYHLGSWAIFAELKADGKKLAKLQEIEQERHRKLNYISLDVLGHAGVDALLDVLSLEFSPEVIALRIDNYLRDASKIMETIEEMRES